MAKSPTRGIHIGGKFKITDDGKLEANPTPRKMPVSAKIAQKKSKRVRVSKKIAGGQLERTIRRALRDLLLLRRSRSFRRWIARLVQASSAVAAERWRRACLRITGSFYRWMVRGVQTASEYAGAPEPLPSRQVSR